MMSSMERLFEDTWTFACWYFRLIQLNTMGHDIVPRLLKARLEDRFIVGCLAHGDMIENERMDMISAPQASECHVTADLWLQLAT